MSIDQLPPDFAPYHMVRLDLPQVQCLGRYYSRKLALADLNYNRRAFPDYTWGVLYDGGLLEETPAKPQLRLLHKAA